MSYSTPLPWTLDSLDLSRIDVAKVRHNEDLFLLLCSASFVESGSDLQAQHLVNHFAGDEELQGWLRQHWEHEELQHGRALTAYVRAVWPEFDWEKSYQSFWLEYSALYASAPLEPCRGLELAARCAVETSTAGHYRALNEMTDEPVLKQLTNHIKSDEVRHFKHFYQQYLKYREREGFGRYKVFRAILRRVKLIRGANSDMALRHVFNQCYPNFVGNQAEFQRIRQRAHGLLRRHLPAAMTVKMLLKPLELPAGLQTAMETPLAKFTERLFLN